MDVFADWFWTARQCFPPSQSKEFAQVSTNSTDPKPVMVASSSVRQHQGAYELMREDTYVVSSIYGVDDDH